jgi:broad specificity phosphatase PhoE
MLVVRHGQSVWNAEGRWQGHADPPLSALGVLQAKSAAAALGSLDAIVASDLARAVETARTIAGELGLGPVATDARLREVDAGEWTGLTRDEIEVAWPGFLTAGHRPPAFEPWAHVAERAAEALHRIGRLHPGGQVLVVSHSGVVRSLERHLAKAGPILPNLGGTWFDVDGEVITVGERVLLVDEHDVQVTTPRQL